MGKNTAEKWLLFKKRWENYIVVAEFPADSEAKKKAYFLHCIGDEALKAYNSFTQQDDAKVSDIIEMFDNFIVGETNVTYERYIFNKRSQQEGESFELFYGDVQRLIKPSHKKITELILRT